MDRERYQRRLDLVQGGLARQSLASRWRSLRLHPSFYTWVTVGALILVGTLARRLQIFHNLNEQFGFRQTQTAMTIREYAVSGIDLTQSPLPVLGAPFNVPMEFPLFQAIASLFVKAGASSDTAGRFLSLIFFQLTAILVAVLAIRWTTRMTAVIAVALFEFTPFGIEWGAASLIEFMATFLVLAMILGVGEWFRRRSVIGLVIAGITGPLAFAVKVTTAAPWCLVVLAIGIVLLRERGWRQSWRTLFIGYAIGPGLGLIAGLAWTRYSDVVKAASPYTNFLTSSSLTDWNFGTLEQRVTPALLNMIAVRVQETIAGPFAITLLIAVVLVFMSPVRRLELAALCTIPFFAVAIFTNLYIQHDYYLAAIFPALVILVAHAVATVATRLVRARAARYGLGAVLTVFLLFFMWVSPFGLHYASLFVHDAAVPAASQELKDETEPGSEIIMAACTWDPTILYYADREGLSMQGNAGGPVVKLPAGYDLSAYDYVYQCDPQANLDDFLPSSMHLVKVADKLYKIKH